MTEMVRVYRVAGEEQVFEADAMMMHGHEVGV
jgi:hypothetical protein